MGGGEEEREGRESRRHAGLLNAQGHGRRVWGKEGRERIWTRSKHSRDGGDLAKVEELALAKGHGAAGWRKRVGNIILGGGEREERWEERRGRHDLWGDAEGAGEGRAEAGGGKGEWLGPDSATVLVVLESA
jgi:hypothetical protein